MEKNFIGIFKLGTCHLLGDLETPHNAPLNSDVTQSWMSHRYSET